MNKDRYTEKRERVLEAIKPICEVFNIKEYDYIYNEKQERLVVNGQEIGCADNSISAVVDELIIYIFVKTVVKNRSIGAFERQTVNKLTQYWFVDGIQNIRRR